MVELEPIAVGTELGAELPARRIEVTLNGPYEVFGGLPLTPVTIVETPYGEPIDFRRGEPFATGERYALCRCGRSATKPFCDASHERVGFDGTETADRTPRSERARLIRWHDVAFTDDQPLCTHAGYCGNRTTDVWTMVRSSDDPEVRGTLERMVGLCPSGRLIMEPRPDDDPPGPAPGEIPPEILLEADGPIWVRGDVAILAADGSTWERRERVALCRCGRSANKPFCNGTHDEVGFRDGSH